MLCRCVMHITRKAYATTASPSTRRGARSSRSAGKKSKKTGPNWCAKLSNRSGSRVSGTIAPSKLQKFTASGRLIGASTSSSPAPPNQALKNGKTGLPV